MAKRLIIQWWQAKGNTTLVLFKDGTSFCGTDEEINEKSKLKQKELNDKKNNL